MSLSPLALRFLLSSSFVESQRPVNGDVFSDLKKNQMVFQVFQITSTAITLRILLKPQDSLGFKDVFPVFSVVKRTVLPRNNSDFMSELSISWNSQGEWTLAPV